MKGIINSQARFVAHFNRFCRHTPKIFGKSFRGQEYPTLRAAQCSRNEDIAYYSLICSGYPESDANEIAHELAIVHRLSRDTIRKVLLDRKSIRVFSNE